MLGGRLLKSLRRVRKATRHNDIVHAFNPDMGLLALIAGTGLGRPVVTEIADTNEAQTAKSLQGTVVRALDKFNLEHCRLLIATSEQYFR